MGAKENAEQRELLYARLDDLCELSFRGELGISDFFSPADLHFGTAYLKKRGVSFFAYGGYPDAERQRFYIFPDYMNAENILSENFEDFLEEYGFSANIAVIKIIGSGYRSLTHRDFLGSVLGLGIERSVIGDILITEADGKEAVLLCDSGMANFILSELTLVANDKVKTKEMERGEWIAPGRRMQPIHDTVASGRLDAVVAALCNLSRDKARTAVESGLVEIDFESEERPDRSVSAPAVISVRGVGKFRVLSLCDKTKKGRYRLEAEKYM